jgi:hypothetical protein
VAENRDIPWLAVLIFVVAVVAAVSIIIRAFHRVHIGT